MNMVAVQTREMPQSEEEQILKLADEVHARLLRDANANQLAGAPDELLSRAVEQTMNDVLREKDLHLSSKAYEQLRRSVINEVVGYGPIHEFIEDPTVNEIMVNGPDMIYVERNGHIERVNRRFRDDEHVMRIIEKIVAPLGRRIDESNPMVDARLPDGSRVNAIIPPCAILGPCLTIRKFSRKPLSPDDLVRLGTMTEDMKRFLEACVKGRLNIIVSGGTGSGKTTTLNALSSFIPHDERIITVEDAAELKLQQEHVVPLETKPPNIEGRGEVTIRDLVRNALRMRPDRIVVGEVRGAEALDMLQAMNTGHDGSMSTLHSNSPRDTLSRLETMVLMAGTELPARAIREQIASAIDLIVHQERLRDGSRKIVNITEVQGMEGDTILLQDIFVFRQTGIDSSGHVVGRHVATGVVPLFIDRIEAEGLSVPREIFLADAAPAGGWQQC